MSGNQFFTILTEIGKRKFRDAIAMGGCIDLREIAVGDGSGRPIEPSTDMTALVNEVYRAPISDNTMDPDNPAYAILNLVIPIEEGGWHVREAGVYDADGDLIFVGSLPSTYKPLPSMGVASDLSINLIIYVENAETITITVDPSKVLASQAWAQKAIEDAIAEAWNNYRPQAGRVTLEDTTTIYVRQNGDDSLPGSTEETAKGSIEGALDMLATLDPRRQRVVIDLGEGQFTAPEKWMGSINAGTGVVGYPLVFQGKGKDATTITGDFGGYAGGFVDVRSLCFTGTVSWADNGVLWLHDIRLQGTGGWGLFAYRGAMVKFDDDTSDIQGQFSRVFSVDSGAHVRMGQLAIVGNVTCEEFCRINGGTVHIAKAPLNAEGLAGRKWHLFNGGVLATDGRDPEVILPGNEPGITSHLPLAGMGAGGGQGRIRATGDLVIYVRKEGDDSNDGLSAESAKQTILAARNALAAYDLGTYRATIDIGPGEYAEQLAHHGMPCLSSGGNATVLSYQGAGKDITVLTCPISVSCEVISIKGLTLQEELLVNDNGSVRLANFKSRGVGKRGLWAYRGGVINIRDSLTEFEGDYSRVLNATENGYIGFKSYDLTISGPLTCQNFGYVTDAGSLCFNGVVNGAENVTGRKWYSARGGMLCLNQDPDVLLPGTIAGHGVQAAVSSIQPIGMRAYATADTTFYMRADGDDANDGRSEQTAVATLEGAFARINSFDRRDYRIILDIGEGEFAGSVSRIRCGLPPDVLSIQGKGTEKTFFTSRVYLHASFNVDGISFTSLYIAGAGNSVNVGASSVIRVGGKGSTNVTGLLSVFHATLTCSGTIEVDAQSLPNPTGIIWPRYAGYIYLGGTIRFVAEVTASSLFRASLNGRLELNGFTVENSDLFNGSAVNTYDGSGVYCRDASTYNRVAALGRILRSNSYAFACQDGSASAWARVTANGGLSSGSNVGSVTRTNTGVYQLTFTSELTNTRPGVTATAMGECAAHVVSADANGCLVHIKKQDMLTDGEFSITLLT